MFFYIYVVGSRFEFAPLFYSGGRISSIENVPSLKVYIKINSISSIRAAGYRVSKMFRIRAVILFGWQDIEF